MELSKVNEIATINTNLNKCTHCINDIRSGFTKNVAQEVFDGEDLGLLMTIEKYYQNKRKQLEKELEML